MCSIRLVSSPPRSSTASIDTCYTPIRDAGALQGPGLGPTGDSHHVRLQRHLPLLQYAGRAAPRHHQLCQDRATRKTARPAPQFDVGRSAFCPSATLAQLQQPLATVQLQLQRPWPRRQRLRGARQRQRQHQEKHKHKHQRQRSSSFSFIDLDSSQPSFSLSPSSSGPVQLYRQQGFQDSLPPASRQAQRQRSHCRRCRR